MNLARASAKERRRRELEARISREARRFDLWPLLSLLREEGYDRQAIYFESATEASYSPSIVEAVRFTRSPERVVITLNLGLFGDGTLLPSYFLQVIESSPAPERFYDFVRFFDHRLAEGYLRAVYPESEGGPFGEFDRILRSFFRMLGLGSVSSLSWLFQLYFPDVRVEVSRQAFPAESSAFGFRFRSDPSRLDGTGVIGREYSWEASGFVVDLTVERDRDDHGRVWPDVLQARLEAKVLPSLEPFRIPLIVRLTVLEHEGWAQIDEPGGAEHGHLGYQRLRDKKPAPSTFLLYRGVTGASTESEGDKDGMFLYKHFTAERGISEREDIIRNLRNVLGSRRGTSYFLRSFGLTEVGYRTQEEMVTMLMAEIRENIRLYEPRVELVELEEGYDESGGRAHLSVQLRVRGSEEKVDLVVDLGNRTFDFQGPPAPRDGEGGR